MSSKKISVILIALWVGTALLAFRVGVHSALKGNARSLALEVSLAVTLAQTGQSSNDRDTAAELLCAITHDDAARQVNDESLRSIIALLDTKDDSVRYWVALCLGNFGPRAKPAVPKLLSILAEMDCVKADSTSADAIRPALKRIGVEAPPRRCE